MIRPRYELHPIHNYLRELVDKLPKFDEYGNTYKMKASAKPKSQKVEDRDYHRGSAALRRDLHSNPHFIARPSARALAHRPANGLWSEPEMKLPRLTYAQIDGLNRTHARELCRQCGL